MGDSLMHEGFQILYFGMGTVFVFLMLLVIVIKLMTLVVKNWTSSQHRSDHPHTPDIGPVSAEAMIDPLTIKIIQKALLQHLHNKSKNT